MSFLFPSLSGYRRSWLIRDLITGITIAAVAIPGQIAVAHLAGMPPATGLYAFIAACVVTAIITTNRHLTVAQDSTTAPMVAAGIVAIAAAGTGDYSNLVILVSLIVGLIFIAVAICKMSWIGDLLSIPIITGFMGGVAIIIVVSQLPDMLGLPAESGHVLDRLGELIRNLDHISWLCVAVSVTSLVALFIGARLTPKIPGILVVVIAAIFIVAILNLRNHGLAVLGPLPKGLPPLHFPHITLTTIREALPTALAVALIALAQTAATSRSAGVAGNFEINIRRDFGAVGASNVAASILGAAPVDASPSSTALVGSSRARTQAWALISAAILLVIVIWGGELVADLPYATLAAVMIFISVKIFRFDEMKRMYRLSKPAFALMALTLAGVVVLGVELGVLIALFAALIDRARRTARPEILTLTPSSSGDWGPQSGDDERVTPAGVVVRRLNGPLWFANANWFHQEMLAAIADGPNKPRQLIVDTSGMDDIDYTGTSTLLELDSTCTKRGVQLDLVITQGNAKRAIRMIGVDKALGEQHVFASVEDAIASASGAQQIGDSDD